jgi:ABC-2 type transport system permease protein
MGELKGIYALWYREYKVFLREKSRVISSVVNPLLWFLIIGGGIGSAIAIEGVNYQTFIYPGVLIQSVLFSSIFFGVYIVWDKKIDFLKEVLVSPMSRTGIFVGKVLGGSTDSYR